MTLMNGVNLLSLTVDDIHPSAGGTTNNVQLTVAVVIMADNEFEAVQWLMDALAQGGA